MDSGQTACRQSGNLPQLWGYHFVISIVKELLPQGRFYPHLADVRNTQS